LSAIGYTLGCGRHLAKAVVLGIAFTCPFVQSLCKPARSHEEAAPGSKDFYDAQAPELIRALSIDARCLHLKAKGDHDFCYEVMQRLIAMLVEHAAQLQTPDAHSGSLS
jgi:hypothetical protein